MTRDAAETLEEMAAQAARRIYDAVFLVPERNSINRVDAIADGVLSALSRAVERACKAVCPWCEDGLQVGPDLQHHSTQTEGLRWACKAEPIRRALALPEPQR